MPRKRRKTRLSFAIMQDAAERVARESKRAQERAAQTGRAWSRYDNPHQAFPWYALGPELLPMPKDEAFP